MKHYWGVFALLHCLLGVVGCTSVQVDQMRLAHANIDTSEDKLLVLGRHHSPEYETEPDLISCVSSRLEFQVEGLQTLEPDTFRDAMFPWFEPRYAPLHVPRLAAMLEEENVQQKIDELGVRYVVWIEGATETVNQAGSMGCSIGPGFGGCVGFGMWENESDYEATIWDMNRQVEVGRISTDAQGTSYMPAIIVPIPLLARVQNNACDAISQQVANFMNPTAQ